MYKGIILHWTAGNYKPSSCDMKHYHFLIDGDGKIYEGIYKPQDNEKIRGNHYAAHCGGGNTGRIGIAICCMKNENTQPKQIQIEHMCCLASTLCKLYGLKPKNCMTHAKFGQLNSQTTSAGKIDINWIPHENLKGIDMCNKYLVNKIQWYFNRLKNNG